MTLDTNRRITFFLSGIEAFMLRQNHTQRYSKTGNITPITHERSFTDEAATVE